MYLRMCIKTFLSHIHAKLLTTLHTLYLLAGRIPFITQKKITDVKKHNRLSDDFSFKETTFRRNTYM